MVGDRRKDPEKRLLAAFLKVVKSLLELKRAMDDTQTEVEPRFEAGLEEDLVAHAEAVPVSIDKLPVLALVPLGGGRAASAEKEDKAVASRRPPSSHGEKEEWSPEDSLRGLFRPIIALLYELRREWIEAGVRGLQWVAFFMKWIARLLAVVIWASPTLLSMMLFGCGALMIIELGSRPEIFVTVMERAIDAVPNYVSFVSGRIGAALWDAALRKLGIPVAVQAPSSLLDGSG